MLSTLIEAFFSRLCRLARYGERGTGVAEVTMLSLVAASGVFATTIITSGDALMQQFERTVHSSVAKVGGAMEVRGSVIVTAAGAPLRPETIQFSLGTFGELAPIGTDPQQGGLTITYHDSSAVAMDVPYSVRFSPGNNGDASLDSGELMTVSVRVADIEAIAGKSVMQPGKKWTLELNVPDGASLEFSRTLPSILTPVTALR